MGCIEKKPVNQGNFLRWHVANDLVAPFGNCPAICGPTPGPCDVFQDYSGETFFHALPAVNGDRLHFFINSRVPFAYASPGTLRIGLLSGGALVSRQNAPQTVADHIDPARYFLHGSFLIDCLPDGLYNPAIYRDGTNEVLLIANPVEVQNRQRWQKETVFVRYRHSRDIMNFRYKDLPNFWNEFRLDLTMHRAKLPTTEETYRDANGRTRSASLEINRTYEIDTHFWDAQSHEAGVIMFASSDVEIDGKKVKRIEGFDPAEYFQDGSLTAKTTVEDLEFSLSVSNC